MKTVLLDRTTWDLVLDLNGNIAVASDPYSLAQDAASAIKTFIGECWYNTGLGIPYWTQILGKTPVPFSLMKKKFEGAAMTVPGVVFAHCVISSFSQRRIRGQVQIKDATGQTATAAF